MSTSKKVLVLAAMVLLVIIVGTCDRTITRVEEVNNTSVLSAENCFVCHSDQNTFIIAAEEQWKNSVHASSLNIDRGASSSCAGCHSSEGFVQRTQGETVTGHDNPTPIHCFTCHAPHTEGDFGLRWTSTAMLQNGESFDLSDANLCVACHQARRNVDTYIGSSEELSEHWGPHHSVQGDMLIGSNGYEYSWYDYEQTRHRSATSDGCLDCHFKATSNSVVGGHAFNMKFELRGEGGEGEEVLNTGACDRCHGELDDFNKGVASFAVQDSVDALMEHLHTLLETAGLVDSTGHPLDDVVTSADSAGAVWNFLMAEEDRSHGIHNRKYIMGLLESGIMYMEGSFTPARVSEEPRSLDEHAAVLRRRAR